MLYHVAEAKRNKWLLQEICCGSVCMLATLMEKLSLDQLSLFLPLQRQANFFECLFATEE